MRIYISGGITNVPDYYEKFEKAEAELINEYGSLVEVFNPARISRALPELTHDEYMTLCFELLNMSDMIAFLPNYRESVGACMEYGYARALELHQIFLKGEGE